MKTCIKCNSTILNDNWECRSCGWKSHYKNGFPILDPSLEQGSLDYPTGSHDRLAKIEEKNFWFSSRSKLICNLFVRYFQDANDFLDIGCGTGFVLSEVSKIKPNMKCYGAEGYTSGLVYAKKRLPSATFVQLNALNIPYIEAFDVIGAFDIIEHIDNDDRVLSQIYQALKPDGKIIITVPQHQWLWSHIDENSGHKRRYSRELLINKIKNAGFSISMVSSFVSFLLPLMALSRMKRTKKKELQPGLRIRKDVNKIFSEICRIERMLIDKGIYLPFGGSLVCVAKK